jgi:hypothetical protein
MMTNNKYEGTGFVVVGFIVGCCLMWAIMQSIHVQKKYKMNLKCVQGELYEEIRPNFYIKSHLNVLNKGLFNMDTIAWLTTIYVAIYLGVIINDNASKEPPKEPPKVEQTK